MEGHIVAMQAAITEIRNLNHENKTNVTALRGQLDQTNLAQRVNRLEEVGEVIKSRGVKAENDLAVGAAQLNSVTQLATSLSDAIPVLAKEVGDIDLSTYDVRLGLLDNEMNKVNDNLGKLASVTNGPPGLVPALVSKVKELEQLMEQNTAM